MHHRGPGPTAKAPTTNLTRQAEQTQRRSNRPKSLSKSLSTKIAQHLSGAPAAHHIRAESEEDTFKVIEKTAEKGYLPVEAGLAGLKAGFSQPHPQSPADKQAPSPLNKIKEAYRKEINKQPEAAHRPAQVRRSQDSGFEW